MIDFIIKYWIEILLTSITSGIIYIFKQYIGLKNGMIALLRNEIIRIYDKQEKLGYCPSYMKENLKEMAILDSADRIYRILKDLSENENW